MTKHLTFLVPVTCPHKCAILKNYSGVTTDAQRGRYGITLKTHLLTSEVRNKNFGILWNSEAQFAF